MYIQLEIEISEVRLGKSKARQNKNHKYTNLRRPSGTPPIDTPPGMEGSKAPLSSGEVHQSTTTDKSVHVLYYISSSLSYPTLSFSFSLGRRLLISSFIGPMILQTSTSIQAAVQRCPMNKTHARKATSSVMPRGSPASYIQMQNDFSTIQMSMSHPLLSVLMYHTKYCYGVNSRIAGKLAGEVVCPTDFSETHVNLDWSAA
ncbi:hypothetical protein EDC01DRAFT_533077 [Geopyxis carbonaria]|nr:hypothetical protein EDC01DRAFT_533077 [Geopyxis carbonaria]